MTYFAWGEGANDDLFGDRRNLFLVFVFFVLFVIVVVYGGCGKLIGKLQSAAPVIVLKFSTKGEAFHMDLDVRRRHNRLLGSWIHDDAPISSFQHQTTRE